MLRKLRNKSSQQTFVLWCVVFNACAILISYLCHQQAIPAIDSLLHEGNTLIGTFDLRPTLEALRYLLDLAVETTKHTVAATLTGVVFIFIWLKIKDDEHVLSDVEVLDRQRCNDLHLSVMRSTSVWCHDGHLANWVRRHVLPEFIRRSKSRIPLKLHAAILDPRDDSVCDLYLSHIRGLPADQQTLPDLEALRVDLCATIWSFCRARVEAPDLDLQIRTKRATDYIRDDIGSDCAFLTVVGSDTPGIAIRKRGDKSIFYNIIVTNFGANWQRYEPLAIASQGVLNEVRAPGPEGHRVEKVLRAILGKSAKFVTLEFAEKVALRANSSSAFFRN